MAKTSKTKSSLNKILALACFVLMLVIAVVTLNLTNKKDLKTAKADALTCASNQCLWTSSSGQQCCGKYGDPPSCGTYDCACLGKCGTTPTSSCTIQGYKVVMPGNRAVAPASAQTVSLDGVAKTTANPYYIKVTKGTTHTVSVPAITGYRVGYTLCLGSTGCHGATPVSGSSVSFNCNAGYADLWWHYTPDHTVQGFKVMMPNMDHHVLPADNQTVYLNGVAQTTANPYYLTHLNPGTTYTVSVSVPSGFKVGYTMCSNAITCHTQTPVMSNSVTFTATGTYTDLWWHYYPPTASASCSSKDVYKWDGVWGTATKINNSCVTQNTTIMYEMNYKNNLGTTAYQVTIKDKLPKEMQFVASKPGSNCSVESTVNADGSHNVNCIIGQVAAYATAKAYFTATAIAYNSSIYNSFYLQYNNGGTFSNSNTCQVCLSCRTQCSSTSGITVNSPQYIR